MGVSTPQNHLLSCLDAQLKWSKLKIRQLVVFRMKTDRTRRFPRPQQMRKTFFFSRESHVGKCKNSCASFLSLAASFDIFFLLDRRWLWAIFNWKIFACGLVAGLLNLDPLWVASSAYLGCLQTEKKILFWQTPNTQFVSSHHHKEAFAYILVVIKATRSESKIEADNVRPVGWWRRRVESSVKSLPVAELLLLEKLEHTSRQSRDSALTARLRRWALLVKFSISSAMARIRGQSYRENEEKKELDTQIIANDGALLYVTEGAKSY